MSLTHVNTVSEKRQSSVDIDLIDQYVVNSERFNLPQLVPLAATSLPILRLYPEISPNPKRYYEKTGWIKHV